MIDVIWLCTWKTKFMEMTPRRLFRVPSNGISHRIHIVKISCSQLPARSGIFCLLVEVCYWACGLRFVYTTINLAILGIIVKVKLPAKYCLHSFEWFSFQIRQNIFPLLSKAFWWRINIYYSKLFFKPEIKRDTAL